MPLQKALVSVNFTQGVDKKTDEKLLDGKLTRLDNGVFADKRSITRRSGHTHQSAIGTSNFTDGGLFAVGDSLLLRNATEARVHNPVSFLTGSAANHSAWLASKRRVARRTSTQVEFDSAVNLTGYVAYAWTDSALTTSSSGFMYAVAHERGGTTSAVSYSTAMTGTTLPRVLCLSDALTFGFLWVSAGNLYFGRLFTGSTTISSVATIATDVHATPAMDAVVFNGGVAIAYRTSGSELKVLTIDNTTATTNGPVTLAEDPSKCISLTATGDSRLVMLWSTSANVRCATYSTTLSTVGAAFNVAAGSTLDRITAVAQPSGTTVRYFGDTTGNSIVSAVVTSAGTVSTASSTFLRNAHILTAPFFTNAAPSSVCIGIGNYEQASGNYQPTAFVVQEASTGNPRVIGRFLGGTSAGKLTTCRVPSVRASYVEPGYPVLLLGERGRLAFQNATDVTPEGICEITLRQDAAGSSGVERNRLAPVEHGSIAYLPGAVLTQFTGGTRTDVGFLTYPCVALVTATGVGSVANGTYQYRAVFEYVDDAGRLHRSAPSLPMSLTISTGPTGVQVIVDSANKFASAAMLSDGAASVVLYRTTSNGTTLYRLNSVASPIQNRGNSANTVTYSDSAADSSITSNEILYTNGGELESIAAPASAFAVMHQQRLFLLEAEDRTALSFSKSLVDGYGPEFNENLRMLAGAQGGDIVGIASLDDKLVLLRQRCLQFIGGEGPDDTGAQNGYSAPQLITTDTGCVSAASVVQTPDGVMFKGQRGIYLLNRSLQLVWVGEPVESLTGVISSATLIPGKGQVRFTCPDASPPRVLVWDYNVQQWSSFTGVQFDAYAATSAGIYALTRSLALWKEGTGVSGDNTTPFPMVLETPWIHVSGLQGFQRVWRALFLGTADGRSTVTIEVAYDYSATYTTAATVDTATVAEFGVSGGLIQMRHHMERQKCQAVRFRITCDGTFPGSGASLGCSLANLTLEVGVKRGGAKLSSTKTVT